MDVGKPRTALSGQVRRRANLLFLLLGLDGVDVHLVRHLGREGGSRVEWKDGWGWWMRAVIVVTAGVYYWSLDAVRDMFGP